jgi:hypothetical protein
VEVVRPSRSGEWLRACQYGYHTADVRSPAELEQFFPLAELQEEEDGLALAA